MENWSKVNICCVILFLSYSAKFVECTSDAEDLTLTLGEKRALDEFKPVITPHLTRDFMKEDIYLIRWLRAHNLNIQQTERAFIESLRWRKEFKIDTIANEDWSDMIEDFNYAFDILDKEGRPVSVNNLGRWDVRKAILTGKSERLLRYTFLLMESAMQKVIELEREGKNVTRFTNIFNMDGFNAVQQGCARCTFLYLNFVTRFQQSYPEFVHEIIFLNAPPTFEIVMTSIRPILSAKTRKMLKIFGTDKRQWSAHLDKEISRNQRRPDLGGIRQQD